MGRVLVGATLENEYDLYEVIQGRRKPEEVRRVEVKEALVDTGSAMLMLPGSMIRQLGLVLKGKRRMESIDHVLEVEIFGLVKLTIDGRSCPLDVGALPDNKPVLIGQLPLEHLDFVVDPGRRQVIANPAHDGAWVLDAF